MFFGGFALDSLTEIMRENEKVPWDFTKILRARAFRIHSIVTLSPLCYNRRQKTTEFYPEAKE